MPPATPGFVSYTEHRAIVNELHERISILSIQLADALPTSREPLQESVSQAIDAEPTGYEAPPLSNRGYARLELLEKMLGVAPDVELPPFDGKARRYDLPEEGERTNSCEDARELWRSRAIELSDAIREYDLGTSSDSPEELRDRVFELTVRNPLTMPNPRSALNEDGTPMSEQPPTETQEEKHDVE